ncbi:MAG: chorismate-binding protein [Cyclobacteriaceae bacterium]|jgi:isochorismate synthase|nr:chorismate-binding protein [Cyclobacteriaceae bacterium]
MAEGKSIDISVKNKNYLHVMAEALQKGFAVAMWRLPNANEKQLLICEETIEIEAETPFEEFEKGFVIAPFLPGSKKFFLKADGYWSSIQNEPELSPEFSQKFSTHNNADKEIKALTFKWHIQQQKVSSSNQPYQLLVEKAIRFIESGQTEKIVPSRTQYIETKIDLLKSFDALCANYPSAMVSLISTPATGTWLGATPELLVAVENDQYFKTVALAGTKPYLPGTDLKSVAWTQKEIEEQALVERYIIQCLKKIRLREYEEFGPKTIVAGNLLHLKSEFIVDMKATNFPQLGSVMLQLLHPTSAVCGMPLSTSLDFLKNEEGYPRSLYSGYLGPVKLKNHTQLFVNLRCLQVLKNGIQLYAGAGVTADSDPQKEFEETEMKMATLLKVIEA